MYHSYSNLQEPPFISGINVSKKRDSKDSANSKRGSQEISSRKRGSQESKCGSQSRSPIEESPEHEPCKDVIDEEAEETFTTTSKRVRFFSISLKLSPDKGKKKLRNGTPPINKKAASDVMTFAVCVEPSLGPAGQDKNDEVDYSRSNEEKSKITLEINKDNELTITMPVTKV